MCGIVGILQSQKMISESFFHSMINTITHRGPDDNRMWTDEAVMLGHVRLSIHDLSEAGAQPMQSVSGRFVIIFNGEIYNYQEIKKTILTEKNILFRGNSDTEVLINAIELWGIEKTLKQCKGMFAFALWDKSEKKLYLARDRFGEKPLYYGVQNNTLAFASELKALKPLKAVGWPFDIDRRALTSYMRFGYVPSPYSIYENIGKLGAGCYAVIDQTLSITIRSYWEAKSVLTEAKFTGSYEEAVNALELKLKDTLRLQMCSDVPLGAFLSGGVDSSAIVALMQSLSSEKIKTFSIGFENKIFNEAPFAQAVASHLGTDHTELYATERDALNVIPHLPDIYDEPFADSSQIPTFLVSQLARKKVTVSLSGDAGDELFCGYNRYFFAEKVSRAILKNPPIRWVVSNTPTFALRLAGHATKRYANLFDKLMKLQNLVRQSPSPHIDFYKNICSQIYLPQQCVKNGVEYDIYSEKKLLDMNLSFQEWMMYTDSQTYLTDDILVKVDRAAMAVSLETRVPFLDHDIYAFAWSLPLSYKLKNGVGKSVLRDVLYRHVPKNLIERPKMGFGVPLGDWLRGDLKEWAASLLDTQKIAQQGYLNATVVTQYWNEHLSGKRNWQYALWNILMFQAWLNAQ